MNEVSDSLQFQLIHFCAPVLAGQKAGGMFSISKSEHPYLIREIRTLNNRLNTGGLFFFTFCRCVSRELLFLYNRPVLAEILRNPDAQRYLAGKGYRTPCTVEHALFQLQAGFMLNREFPHEVGLFLGYPLEDVIGFETNSGKNYKCCGCWKVYGNVLSARNRFRLYADCTRCMVQEFVSGKKTFEQLCHAA